ncbi:hypothetical protein CSUB01_12437 [Colletotrichum sublineola]|uniref:Uncharacterized protein n=1 Tax=Colletotrichum sublineola TaxID=1173701 RepID=A0A066XV63_COLSU|nr:hypothetical protein CSUB01_12437 [Colletotrichum sublineola]
MKSVCVPRHCGLCRYQLNVGDFIVAGFTDSFLGIEYVQCRGRCHHDEKGVGCHIDCNNIVSPETFSEIHEVTAPDFEPSTIANKQRLRWLRSWLASILRTATQYRLPLEICSDIASRALEHEYERRLAVWYIDGIRGEVKSRVSRVALAKKIYARTVDFEGVRYIARLTNTTAADGRDILVFDPTSRTPADRLYVASDHLGIRQLLFTNSSGGCAIKQEPDVWWKTSSLNILSGVIRVQTDGLKLRKLTGKRVQLPKVAWGQPSSVPNRVRVEPICNAEPTFREDVEFYQALRTMDESALWIFMPLHAGEVLTEIWKYDGPLREAIALLLKTLHPLPPAPSRDGFTASGGPWIAAGPFGRSRLRPRSPSGAVPNLKG